MQTLDYASPEQIFASDYAYLSSVSNTWLDHARRFAESMIPKLELDGSSMVVEVASNDGYLLKNFKENGIPCIGIEPTASTANRARELGLAVVEEFFDEELATHLAERGDLASLLVANNVLAHVPNINSFVRGVAVLLRDDGVATFEFPSLVKLVDEAQFDTIYHEHFSYLSLTAVARIFKTSGLEVFDVKTLPTHGGSLRVYAKKAETSSYQVQESVDRVLAEEENRQVCSVGYYSNLQANADHVRAAFMTWLESRLGDGQRVAAYGAAAKGNTFLNFCNVDSSQINFVVDNNVLKIGKLLPGTGIPIVGREVLGSTSVDSLLVLPWNLYPEIANELVGENWSGELVRAMPELSSIEV